MAELTIKEAAEALGVSIDTIRRRIKDNKVKAWKVQGTYGLQWVIDSNSLAEYQQVIETVPVKYHMDADSLMHNIGQTVYAATQEGTKQGILKAMEENKMDYEKLKNEIEELQQQNEILIDLISNKQSKTLVAKIKNLFK